METMPFFLTNPKWYTLEVRQNNDGITFQRFELTNKASKEAIASFKQTMIDIAPESAITTNNLNRFQQALGYAARKHFFNEQHGLDDNAVQDELLLISSAIRSYQLLDDDLTAPNTLIFKKRIATLYRQFLKQHPKRIKDATLNDWIMAQDKNAFQK